MTMDNDVELANYVNKWVLQPEGEVPSTGRVRAVMAQQDTGAQNQDSYPVWVLKNPENIP